MTEVKERYPGAPSVRPKAPPSAEMPMPTPAWFAKDPGTVDHPKAANDRELRIYAIGFNAGMCAAGSEPPPEQPHFAPPPPVEATGRVTYLSRLGRIMAIDINSADDGSGEETHIYIRRSRFGSEYPLISKDVQLDDVLWVQGQPLTTASGRAAIDADKVRAMRPASRQPKVPTAVPVHAVNAISVPSSIIGMGAGA